MLQFADICILEQSALFVNAELRAESRESVRRYGYAPAGKIGKNYSIWCILNYVLVNLTLSVALTHFVNFSVWQ